MPRRETIPSIITQEYVLKNFEYKDGHLVRRFPNMHCARGDRIGHIKPTGYMMVKIGEKVYAIHKLIFLYHHGSMPDVVEHIDGDKLNNKIENLRPRPPKLSK
jgi:hypothetical protein